MIIDSFDDRSPAKINVKKNENAVKVDAVIYTFSWEIEKYVTEHYECEKVGEFLMGHGPTSVYLLRHNGKRLGFYRTWVGAPACIGPIEEMSTVLDTDKIVHFGGAGCLDKEIAFLAGGEEWIAPSDAVISLCDALQCVTEFCETGSRPSCIHWQEL